LERNHPEDKKYSPPVIQCAINPKTPNPKRFERLKIRTAAQKLRQKSSALGTFPNRIAARQQLTPLNGQSAPWL
jgi:hypothetical protein